MYIILCACVCVLIYSFLYMCMNGEVSVYDLGEKGHCVFHIMSITSGKLQRNQRAALSLSLNVGLPRAILSGGQNDVHTVTSQPGRIRGFHYRIHHWSRHGVQKKRSKDKSSRADFLDAGKVHT